MDKDELYMYEQNIPIKSLDGYLRSDEQWYDEKNGEKLISIQKIIDKGRANRKKYNEENRNSGGMLTVGNRNSPKAPPSRMKFIAQLIHHCPQMPLEDIHNAIWATDEYGVVKNRCIKDAIKALGFEWTNGKWRKGGGKGARNRILLDASLQPLLNKNITSFIVTSSTSKKDLDLIKHGHLGGTEIEFDEGYSYLTLSEIDLLDFLYPDDCIDNIIGFENNPDYAGSDFTVEIGLNECKWMGLIFHALAFIFQKEGQMHLSEDKGAFVFQSKDILHVTHYIDTLMDLATRGEREGVVEINYNVIDMQ